MKREFKYITEQSATYGEYTIKVRLLQGWDVYYAIIYPKNKCHVIGYVERNDECGIEDVHSAMELACFEIDEGNFPSMQPVRERLMTRKAIN